VTTPFRYQLNLFYLALSFFTRIPVPSSMQYSSQMLNQSSRYFSLVGLLLAFILTLLYLLFCAILPIAISVLLVMCVSMLLTGAFHEDGLADMADGIGGGYTIERRLNIMKDSRLGTYGVVTLVSVLSLKFLLLLQLATYANGVNGSIYLFITALFVGYGLSRAVAGSLIFDMTYVSDEDGSKSKPLAQKQSSAELSLLAFFGLLPLCFYSISVAFYCLLVLLIFRWGFKCWLQHRLGGYTGDCLGAAQQLSEILIYLVITASYYSVFGDNNL